eukprot:gene29105-9372_t
MGKKGKGKAAAVPEVAAGPGISLFGGSKLLTGGEAEALSRTGLGGWLAKQCGAVGMPAPTEVQANCIPQVLAGKDVC